MKISKCQYILALPFIYFILFNHPSFAEDKNAPDLMVDGQAVQPDTLVTMAVKYDACKAHNLIKGGEPNYSAVDTAIYQLTEKLQGDKKSSEEMKLAQNLYIEVDKEKLSIVQATREGKISTVMQDCLRTEQVWNAAFGVNSSRQPRQ
jgi:hypothetical protein